MPAFDSPVTRVSLGPAWTGRPTRCTSVRSDRWRDHFRVWAPPVISARPRIWLSLRPSRSAGEADGVFLSVDNEPQDHRVLRCLDQGATASTANTLRGRRPHQLTGPGRLRALTALLTVVGLRTLVPDEVWGPAGPRRGLPPGNRVVLADWPFIDAWLRVPRPSRRGASHGGRRAHQVDGACIGTINEIFDAEAPFTPRGLRCPGLERG